MLAQQLVTDARPYARLIERDDNDVRQGLLDALADLRLVSDFTNNFYVRLICKRREDIFPHEARIVSHEDANRFFHGTLRARQVSALMQIEVRIKKQP